jgi:putative heme degradation protein
MSTFTVAGSKIFVSATLPATMDSAGYAALTWSEVGELTDIGSVLGRAYNTATHAPIGKQQQTQKKASYTLSNADFMCGWDEQDAGQIIINAGASSYDIYAFKLLKQDGTIRYFTAQVMQYVENNGTVDNIVQGAFTLLRQTDSITGA